MRFTLLPAVLALSFPLGLAAAISPASAETELTIMSYNVWGGGGNEQKPIDETVAVIKAAGADIIGIQETRLEADPCTADVCPPAGESVAKAIATALGYHYYDQTKVNDALWANAIISRYPIGQATPNDLGVVLDVDGRKVYAFNIHLDDSPYQPYQLLNIEYGAFPFLKTEAEAVKFATDTRGPALKLLFEDLKSAEGADAAFIFGDFNEPSFRDWTAETVKAGHNPIPVRFPTTAAIEEAGFTDTYRAAFPDPVAKPAYTWTPTSEPSDPEDHHDRIDFAFARAKDLKVISAAIVGEKPETAEIVVTPWPSDHRATVAKIGF
ncbi:MAG: endonuclease/exonuclease/phosphatase family protein [Rhodospirillaceae bacterium]|nr:endonuclease/exonuclease/phosphatase family protein [Rhodospirillaceae bacterium]